MPAFGLITPRGRRSGGKLIRGSSFFSVGDFLAGDVRSVGSVYIRKEFKRTKIRSFGLGFGHTAAVKISSKNRSSLTDKSGQIGTDLSWPLVRGQIDSDLLTTSEVCNNPLEGSRARRE